MKHILHKTVKHKYFFPVVLGTFFLAFFAVIAVRYIKQARRFDDKLIAETVNKLADIFHRIHASCTIIGFEHQRNYIDFLTVAKFEGNRVGSMSLEYPEKWAGPYMHQPVLMDGKEYEIMHTKKGYFIVPGEGVKLSSGKVIGKDIVLNSNSDIECLSKDPEGLFSQKMPLAARIEVTPGYGEVVLNQDSLEENFEPDY